MAEITVRFGDGGANLNPAGTGKPTLATVLREIADDLALVASDTRFDEETVPIVSNVGLLYYPAESIGLMDNAGAAVAQIASGAAPGAGEFKLAADRRTLTLGDAPADVIVAYIRKIETAPLLESAAEPWVLVDAFTLLVKVDGGAVQTALFETADFGDIGAATAAEVVAVINTDITGATAEVRDDKIVLRSDTEGSGGIIQVTGGTANAGLLDFSTTAVTGTGIKTLAV